MTFRVDAAGRYPGEPGYVDPDAPPSGTPASMHVIPPDSGADTAPEGTGATEIPSSYDPDEARRLASGTATAIRGRSSGWRNRLRAFQRAAGIPVDGRYGGLSYNALVYYGIRNPPPATSAPRPSAAAANYVDRVIANPSGTGTGLVARPSVSQGERRADTGATALAHDASIATSVSGRRS